MFNCNRGSMVDFVGSDILLGVRRLGSAPVLAVAVGCVEVVADVFEECDFFVR